MPLDRASKTDTRQRRAFQGLAAGYGFIFTGGLSYDDDTGEITIDLAAVPGLEVAADGLRIDIGQSPSILALNANGLITQYVTATGSGANIGVTAAATGTAFVRLEAGSGATTLILTPTAAQFGAGATTYSIDSTTGLMGQIDSDGGAVFRIEDTGSNSGGLVMSSTETRLAGFLVSGIDGSPVTIQPQDSFVLSPLTHVHGATGIDIQGGSVHIEGGDTTGSAINTDGGPTIVSGGIPTGTGKSRVKIRTKTSAGAFLDVISCQQASGTRSLSFYGATEVAQQTVDISPAGIHAALVALGLIVSSGSTVRDGVPVVTAVKVANYNAAIGELVRCDPSGGAFAVNLPASAAGNAGRSIEVKNVTASANNITITPNGGNTIDGAATLVIAAARGKAVLRDNGAGDWMVMG